MNLSFSLSEKLSPRELQVALIYREGWEPKTIAARLFRSPSTIHTQLFRIKNKLGVQSVEELRVLLIAHRTVGDVEYGSWGFDA